MVYVDSSYGGGSNDGLKPYATLGAALAAKLTDAATTTYTFKLAPGLYTGGISIDKTTANQSFSIRGSGTNATFIQSGLTFAAGASTKVLYFK